MPTHYRRRIVQCGLLVLLRAALLVSVGRHPVGIRLYSALRICCPKPSRIYCDIALSDSHRPCFIIVFTGTPARCISLAIPARKECGVISCTSFAISFRLPTSSDLNVCRINFWKSDLTGSPAPLLENNLRAFMEPTCFARHPRTSAAVKVPICLPSVLKRGYIIELNFGLLGNEIVYGPPRFIFLQSLPNR